MAAFSRPHAADPPRLGFLVKVFPKVSETFILEEVLGLERLGVALSIYTLADPTDNVAHAAVERVRAPIRRVPSTLAADAWRFVARHLALALRSPWRYAAAFGDAAKRGRTGLNEFLRAGWLAGQMRADGVHHLHAHFISAPADIAALMARMSGMAFSISAHAKDIYLSRPNDLRRRLGAARFTVSCTEFNCRALREAAPGATVHRMYHGVDRGVFSPRVRAETGLTPLILSVGRLRAKKGLDTLIDACRLLRGRGLPFRCEIVGYGEEQARLQDQIDACELGDCVSLAGKLVREQVLERYARAAVYVQPSRITADGDRDGIPNVLLEAMSVGVPVVASRVSGIPELVRHRETGLLVEPDDACALADAMAELIGEPSLGAKLVSQARIAVSRDFDNQHNLQTVLQLLEISHGPAVPHAHSALA
jgi:glycosyltransferase involved in cell wall biosynthesis